MGFCIVLYFFKSPFHSEQNVKEERSLKKENTPFVVQENTQDLQSPASSTDSSERASSFSQSTFPISTNSETSTIPEESSLPEEKDSQENEFVLEEKAEIFRELLERYEVSTRGTTREHRPAYLMVFNLGSISNAERMLLDKLCEEHLIEFRTIQANPEKRSPEELRLKYKELNQFYENYFLEVLDTPQEQEDFRQFVERQIKNSPYYKTYPK
jgi:hypothetical protein